MRHKRRRYSVVHPAAPYLRAPVKQEIGLRGQSALVKAAVLKCPWRR